MEALQRMLSSRIYPTFVKIRFDLALEPAYMAQMVTSGMKQRVERKVTHYRENYYGKMRTILVASGSCSGGILNFV